MNHKIQVNDVLAPQTSYQLYRTQLFKPTASASMLQRIDNPYLHMSSVSSSKLSITHSRVKLSLYLFQN